MYIEFFVVLNWPPTFESNVLWMSKWQYDEVIMKMALPNKVYLHWVKARRVKVNDSFYRCKCVCSKHNNATVLFVRLHQSICYINFRVPKWKCSFINRTIVFFTFENVSSNRFGSIIQNNLPTTELFIPHWQIV